MLSAERQKVREPRGEETLGTIEFRFRKNSFCFIRSENSTEGLTGKVLQKIRFRDLNKRIQKKSKRLHF